MAGETTTLARDFADLLRAFIDHDVRFLVIGAYALAVHGRPRATGDLDLWVDATTENAARTMRALQAFGAPLADLREADLATPGVVFQIGVAPVRIDILTNATGISFGEAWPARVTAEFAGVDIPVIGKAHLVANKRALGRPQDLVDIQGLER